MAMGCWQFVAATVRDAAEAYYCCCLHAALWFVCRPSRLLPRQWGMHGSATNSRHAEEAARKMFTGNAVFHAMTRKQFIVFWRLVSRHAGRKISRVSTSVFRCIGSFCHNKRQAYASGNRAYMQQGFSIYA